LDKFETLKVFIAVATEGSFIAASRALGLSPPSVTRAVGRLEQDLGVRLLHRTTRRIRLSEVGERYLGDAQAILKQLEAAEAAVTGSYGEPQGTLMLTAPVLFGQRYIIPLISEYLALYPSVSVNALLLDRVTNLLEDNLDVAVRLGDLADSGLFFKTVGSIRKVTCAAPSYLEQHGRPDSPDQLRNHHIVHATAVENSAQWHYGNTKVESAAEAGIGITRLMSYQVRDALASGSLEVVLEDYEPPALPVNLLYLEGRHASAKVRAFVDLASQHLSQQLAM